VAEPEIDRILRHTLADFRLSRSEKRVLGNILKQLDADRHELDVLRHRAFEIAREELIDPQSQAVVEWLEEVVKVLLPKGPKPQTAARAHFAPGDDCPRTIANLFGRARRTIDVCVFTITDDRIADAILEAHRRGVAVRIIADNDKAFDAGSDVQRLERQGVPVRVDRTEYHMHHKFAIFDGKTTLTGSYNWTRSAARYNSENFIVTDDPRLTKAFSEAFERLWQDFA